MTLERVVSVTTFTNDNQVTTTRSGRQRPASSSSYIDDERGYSTLPRNSSPNKSTTAELSYSEFARLANTVSQDPICRTSSQRSVLRTASTRAIPSPSTDDLRHRNPSTQFQNDHHRHHPSYSRQQRSSHHHQNHPLHHRPISHAVSSPACNSNYNQQQPTSSSKTPADLRNNNHIDEGSSNSRRRRHHQTSNNNIDHLSSSEGPKSRYRKHENSVSKHTSVSASASSSRNHHHHRRQSREYVEIEDFPKVKKAHSESALFVDKKHRQDLNDDPHHRHYSRDRPVRRNHSVHSSSKPDCNGNPPTPTHTATTGTTTAAIANTSDNGRRRYHRRYSTSPDSPKQPKACALSYVFPWSSKNRHNRRRQRSPQRHPHHPHHHHHHHRGPSSSSPSRDRCRRNLDHDLESETINNRQTTPLQPHQRLSTSRPLSIAPPITTEAATTTSSRQHRLHSVPLSPDTDYPQTPKSAPVRSPFRNAADTIPDPFQPVEDCPISPKSAPAFQFDTYRDHREEEGEEGSEEEENHHPHHRRQYQPNRQHKPHHTPNDKTCRSRSEQRYKSSATQVAARDKSEDAFYRESDSEPDLNSTQKSLGDSRKSLRDSNSRLYTSNPAQSRSNHSSSYNHVRDRSERDQRENHRTVSSSGTTSGDRVRSRQSKSNSRSKSRPSRTEYQGTEEGSQCQNTEESSTDCSTRKIDRATVKPVDLDPRIDSFGRYVNEVDKRVINDAEDFEYRPTDMKGPINLSFCGCGFLGMYHLGVVSSLTQRGPSFLDKVQKFAGASAGALTAALLVTAPEKAEESMVYFHQLSKEIRSKPLGALTPGYSLAKSLRYMLDDFLPEDAHLEASGRLFVSLTNGTTKKNEIWSQFESREELLQVLIASCFIPIYAGSKLPTVRGKRYMDGGLTNNLVQFNTGRTITVSPFDGKSDVGPKAGQEASTKKAHFVNFHNQNLQMNMQNLKRGAHAFFPPRKAVLQEYFDKGRLDASRFLIREGLYEIDVPQQTQSVIYESSV